MKNIKNTVFGVLVLLLIASTTGCHLSTVEAGYVGVKVNKLGGDKGIDHQEVGVGYHVLSWNETLYKYPVFQQNYVWTADKREGSENDESITFQTAEGLSVRGDFGVSYSLIPDSIDTLFGRYRRGINEITDTFLRNMVRDALNQIGGTMEVESVYGGGKHELMTRVEAMVQDQVTDLGIIIDRIYIIDKLELPDQVFQALNRKVAQTQKAQERENQIQEQLATMQIDSIAAHTKLIAARLEAEANRELARSITPELVKWRQLDKWNGVMPQVVGGNGAGVLLDMTK